MSANYRDAICYIDMNLWIYLSDNTAPTKQCTSKELLRHFHQTHYSER